MEKIRTLIVDDEPLAREAIGMMIGKYTDIEVLGHCADAQTTIEAIREQKPDLLFLDIEMPGMSGIDMLSTLAKEDGLQTLPLVVFVTAYDQYAVKAFELHAVDYLLKPFTDERFHRAVEYAKQTLKLRQTEAFHEKMEKVLSCLQHLDSQGAKSTGENQPHTLALNVGKKTVFAPSSDIVWIEAAEHYVIVHARDGDHMCRESISEIEKRLTRPPFLRIHRSRIVNAEYIKEMIVAGKDLYQLRLKNGALLNISRGRQKEIRRFLSLGCG